MFKNLQLHILVAALAFVEYGGSFVGATQLLSIVANLGSVALLAWLFDFAGCLHLVFGDGLHLRPFCAKGGGKGCGF